MREFAVIDLTPTCEVRAMERYRYDLLERVDGAVDLIGRLSASIWRDPGEFETRLGSGAGLQLRWAATSETAGIMSLYEAEELLSLSVLCSGQDLDGDKQTLNAFQRHILRQLHGTEYEGSCEVLQVEERPLIATLGLFAPKEAASRAIYAVADRCFAAAYFRRLGLA